MPVSRADLETLELPTKATPKLGPSNRQDFGWNERPGPGNEAVSTTRGSKAPWVPGEARL